MGADILGKFRTGAASGVATKYLYGRHTGILSVFGSGNQALTQVLGLVAVMPLEEFRVWSPSPDHRRAFMQLLRARGFKASNSRSPEEALGGSQVACTIASSTEPFLKDATTRTISYMNTCGSSVPENAEMTSAAVGSFDTVVVDDIPQAKVEYGDLIQAARAGTFSWESSVALGNIVARKSKVEGRTLKSGGAALEDVAVASMLYDSATKFGGPSANVELD